MFSTSRYRAAKLAPGQRWSDLLSILVLALIFGYGINLRTSILTASVQVEDVRSGIVARYPARWLLDTEGDYVFRVRDMSQTRFKTIIQVSLQPASTVTTARNLADRMTFSRALTFIDYSLLTTPEEFLLREDVLALRVTYTYVYRDPNPFLEAIPAVVIGEDIIVLRGSQALVFTFRADANIYQEERQRFEDFLRVVRF